MTLAFICKTAIAFSDFRLKQGGGQILRYYDILVCSVDISNEKSRVVFSLVYPFVCQSCIKDRKDITFSTDILTCIFKDVNHIMTTEILFNRWCGSSP